MLFFKGKQNLAEKPWQKRAFVLKSSITHTAQTQLNLIISRSLTPFEQKLHKQRTRKHVKSLFTVC